MRGRVSAIILALIVVLGFVFLLSKGKKEEKPAPANVPVESMNITPPKSEPVEKKPAKVSEKAGDVVDLDKDSFAQFINSPVPVVVDFWASNCGACRMLDPVFREVASEMKGKMKFAKFLVDAEGNWEIAEKNSIEATPTMIIFKNGKEMGRLIGYKDKDELKSALENFLK